MPFGIVFLAFKSGVEISHSATGRGKRRAARFEAEFADEVINARGFLMRQAIAAATPEQAAAMIADSAVGQAQQFGQVGGRPPFLIIGQGRHTSPFDSPALGASARCSASLVGSSFGIPFFEHELISLAKTFEVF